MTGTGDQLRHALQRAVAADAPLTERAAVAAGLVRRASGRRWVGIYRVADDRVTNLAWSGVGPPAHPQFRVDEGLTAAAIASAASVVCNDVGTDQRYLTNQEATGSELIVPIVDGGIVVGTLDVEDHRRGAFDESDILGFEALAPALVTLYA